MDAVDVASDPARAASSVSELRELVEEFEDDIADGLTGGYYNLGTHLNLNTIALGLGLDNIDYDPDTFPALVYHLDDERPTVIIFEDGHLSVIDADSGDAVQEAVTITVERMTDLGWYQDDIPDDEDVTVVEIDG
ncbi:hypothetical protein [Haloarcula sebkhae]|uniref:Uncharacterized protein n=2 Tax=Haloarcula sebkhae TaxID=932660 RepID=A0ACC6VIG8_9EURY|nr:hypothetical protein GCM10009067_28180 [Haloarcula sebkhae]